MSDLNFTKMVFDGAERDCIIGQIVVKFSAASRTDSANIEKIVSSVLGATGQWHFLASVDSRGMALIECNVNQDVATACEALRKIPGVEFAEPNERTHTCQGAQVTPTDPMFFSQWWLLTVQGPAAWSITQGSPSVLIAVADSGIPMNGNPLTLSHEDLSNSARIIVGTNFIRPGTPPRDDHGHGTHVTGIASAQSNNGRGTTGMCWNSLVLALKVFDAQGNGSVFAAYQAAVEAIAVGRQRNARVVINYSGGSPNYSATSEEMARAVQDGGAVLCAAAGNSSSAVFYPAALASRQDTSVWYSSVIAVSATTIGDELASFSCRGPQISVSAPGVQILSTMPNYEVTLNKPPPAGQSVPQNYGAINGTSMATPIVTGIAALLWSNEPQLTAPQIRQRLQTAAVDLPPPGRDDFFGFGRVNAFSTLRPSTAPPPPPPPPPPPVDPWDDPAVKSLIDEWLGQAQRCLKKVYPGLFYDQWVRHYGDTPTAHINPLPWPPDDNPPTWNSYRYRWYWNKAADYYVYRVQDYVRRRQQGASYDSLSVCK